MWSGGGVLFLSLHSREDCPEICGVMTAGNGNKQSHGRPARPIVSPFNKEQHHDAELTKLPLSLHSFGCGVVCEVTAATHLRQLVLSLFIGDRGKAAEDGKD